MPVPKHRTSKSKKNMRRAHHFIKPKSHSVCTNCAAVHLPHRVCDSCGFYKGRQVCEPRGPVSSATFDSFE